MFDCLTPLRDLEIIGVIARMVFAFVCGGLIGLERSAKNQPAGMRTHILVCMASAVAATCGVFLYLKLEMVSDMSRIASQVVTGLGFIGAGTIIITKRMSIKGLTTVAGLWTTGVIGLAVGSGYIELGLIGTALVLLTETLMARVSSGIQAAPEYAVELLYNEKTSLDHVLRFCKDNRMSITNLKIQTVDDDGDAKYAAEVSLRGTMKQDALLDKVRQMPGIVAVMAL